MATIHLAVTLAALAAVAGVVFFFWYPSAYAVISGGTKLFSLLFVSAIVLGPGLTLLAATKAKSRSVLRRDMLIIIAIQLVACAYGIFALAAGRPVYFSFEVDRMRVVSAAEVDSQSLQDALPEFRTLPWAGPMPVAVLRPTDPAEVLRSIELALSGVDLSQLPRNWRDYSSQSAVAWKIARPLSVLLLKYPEASLQIQQMAASAGEPVDSLRFLPLVTRKVSWVTLLAPPNARVVGHLALEGFF